MREQFETYWLSLKDLADPIQKETAYLFFMRGWFSHQEERLRELRNEVKPTAEFRVSSCGTSDYARITPTVNNGIKIASQESSIKEPENKWYAEYPEWLKQKIFAAARKQNTTMFDQSADISSAFRWASSDEGMDYWRILSTMTLDEIKTLPESWKPTT
jgi:hypothetical protein